MTDMKLNRQVNTSLDESTFARLSSDAALRQQRPAVRLREIVREHYGDGDAVSVPVSERTPSQPPPRLPGPSSCLHRLL